MEDIKNINKPKSLAEKRRAEREAIKAKIKKQQEQKKFFKDAAAGLKNVGADKPAVAKAKERLTRLANNPNARIQGTTAISYMANNTPMDALRDIGLIPPAGERFIRVDGKQVSTPRKTSPSRKTTVSDTQKKRQTVKQSSKKTTVSDKKKSSATKNKFEGEPRTIAQAKKMGKSYFINKAGKKLAAVTKEDLRAKGLDPNKKSDLTKFLNMKKKKKKAK